MKKKDSRKKKKMLIEKEPAYQDLIKGIRKIVNDAKAQGVDLSERYDLFTCSSCGAYEDELCGEDGRVIELKDGTRVPDALPFTLVNRGETIRTLKSGATRLRSKYTYICGLCGAYQTEVFINEFDEW